METGTGAGEGVKKAIRAGFRKIYSIELSPELHARCASKFKKEIEDGRVALTLGDSSKCLTEILNTIECPATIWLDAHYSAAGTARGEEDTPLVTELEVISKHNIKTHTILIDDLRLFGTKDISDWSGIQLKQVMRKLMEINNDYSLFYENGEIKNDVLAAQVNISYWNRVLGEIEELPILPVIKTRKMLGSLKKCLKNRKTINL
ncbi:MAG: hypothetical protein PHI60_03395 [Candidatus Omnitrophica bacterium]|nr:hypothetical protein [Candidatus Omnitrophota bacterium]